MAMIRQMRDNLMEHYYSLSIYKKITLGFIVTLSLLIILLAVITYRISSSILIGKAVENTAQNLRLVSEKLELIFDTAENYSQVAITNNTIQQIVSAPQTDDPLENYNRYYAVQETLRNIVDAKTFVDAMIMYDLHGNIYDSGGIGGIVNISAGYAGRFEHSFYGMTWEGTQPSNYNRDASGRNVISLFQKFNSARTGTALGLIQLSIDERYIASQYANIDIGAGGDLFIVDQQGRIVSGKAEDKLYASISGEPYWSWVLEHEEEGGRQFRLGNQEELVVARAYPRFGWTIIGTVPIREITKDNQVLTERFFLIGALFVLAAVVLTILIAISITRPLNRIKTTVREVQAGNLDVRLDIKSRDEIGALAREFNKMVGKTKTLMDNVIEEQKKKKEYEFAVMQSQINPHFLYNTLESICGLADLKRNEDVVKVVNQLALFYRGVLSKGSSVVSMEEELFITQTYLGILKIRYGDKISYTFDIEPEAYRYKTVKLLLQPLVENSIYHGLKNKRGKGHIAVRVRIAGNRLKLQVADDGVGMKPEQVESVFSMVGSEHPNKSFGLKITDQRIKLYFGAEYGLKISSEYGAGTVIDITMPLVRLEEETE